jgi:outer membrane protein assembly factor BamB
MIGTLFAILPVLALQDWTEHRGNPARSGCVDGSSVPAGAGVLWVSRSKEHFLAPLGAAGDRIVSVALGAFNTGSLRAYAAADGKVVWHKTAPLIKLPTVGTPAAAGGLLVLGEGMHQTSGSTLGAYRLSDGRSAWRFEVAGDLVHIEASPVIAGGRVYAGGGSAGVICVDPSRVVLDGKELLFAEADAAAEKKWKALQDAYQADLKKDPDFAIPPNEASLPKPAPVLAWQKGQGSWHVDAPLLVSGGSVYAASAFLDKEKLGERALFCLDAGTGAERWKAPLAYNAWGGATLAGDRIVVPCTNIRYDPKEIGHAKGEIVCLKAADGSAAWRRDTQGGVLGSVAAAGPLLVYADTAGQVVALDAASGAPKWVARTGGPYFAGVAVAGDAVYSADIQGRVSCLALADGAKRWAIDLGSDPAVQAPGMVYGGPVVHGGRLYVATANLEGPNANGGTVVVCIGGGK